MCPLHKARHADGHTITPFNLDDEFLVPRHVTDKVAYFRGRGPAHVSALPRSLGRVEGAESPANFDPTFALLATRGLEPLFASDVDLCFKGDVTEV